MIKVNQDQCIGCGMCAGLCPETFVINADGKAEAISQVVTPEAKNAAENCPVGAITVK